MSIPFSDEAGQTRVRLVDPDGESVWFLSAEALAVFKLLFFRPKDLADLERLVAVQGRALDRAYVRALLAKKDTDGNARAGLGQCHLLALVHDRNIGVSSF